MSKTKLVCVSNKELDVMIELFDELADQVQATLEATETADEEYDDTLGALVMARMILSKLEQAND